MASTFDRSNRVASRLYQIGMDNGTRREPLGMQGAQTVADDVADAFGWPRSQLGELIPREYLPSVTGGDRGTSTAAVVTSVIARGLQELTSRGNREEAERRAQSAVRVVGLGFASARGDTIVPIDAQATAWMNLYPQRGKGAPDIGDHSHGRG